MANQKESVDPNELINYAISEGIEEIISSHPSFEGQHELFYKHLDKKTLKERTKAIYSELLKYNIPPQEIPKYLHQEIANYVASGNALDKEGKEFLLLKGLESKVSGNWFTNLFSKHLDGEKYLKNTIKGFQDLYSLFKTGDYAQHMPKLAEAVVKIRNNSFLDNAIDILKTYELMTKEKYGALKKILKGQMQEGAKAITQGIEEYIIPQKAEPQLAYAKAAAFIFGILGILSLFAFGNGITGNVVGNSSNSYIGIIGGIFIVLSLIFFVKGFRKKENRRSIVGFKKKKLKIVKKR